MPAALLASLIWIVPAFLTSLPLSSVTAVPPVGTTEPLSVISISSGAPSLAVEVATGVVILVSILVCAMAGNARSEEHTSELQSLMRNSYAVFCLKKKKKYEQNYNIRITTQRAT